MVGFYIFCGFFFKFSNLTFQTIIGDLTSNVLLAAVVVDEMSSSKLLLFNVSSDDIVDDASVKLICDIARCIPKFETNEQSLPLR